MNIKEQRYTLSDFNKHYPNDDACLQDIFNRKYSHQNKCNKCDNLFKYYRVTNRKCYACQYCGYQIYPLANTIFEKSDTPLRSWFYAIFLFSVSKNGVSAKELQRQLGVTYKCAWRIANKIRVLFDDNDRKELENTVEVDETYIGGKHKGKRGRGSENKTPIIGMAERKGLIKAKVVTNNRCSTVMPIIKEHIKIGSNVMTDEFTTYQVLTKNGYNHQTVNHNLGQYANGLAHTNTIEGFWSQLKRSIDGTYHCVSAKYLQGYVNEFCYRYNQRNTLSPIFSLLLSRI
jgi:transposase-like protein